MVRRPSRSPGDKAKQQAGDRPHEVADGKHPKAHDQLQVRVGMGEEPGSDIGREVAVNREIKPLQTIPNRGRKMQALTG